SLEIGEQISQESPVPAHHSGRHDRKRSPAQSARARIPPERPSPRLRRAAHASTSSIHPTPQPRTTGPNLTDIQKLHRSSCPHSRARLNFPPCAVKLCLCSLLSSSFPSPPLPSSGPRQSSTPRAATVSTSLS